MNRMCPQCKNSLDDSAFGWDLDKKVCNGCYTLNQVENLENSIAVDVVRKAAEMANEEQRKTMTQSSPQERWKKEFIELFEDYPLDDVSGSGVDVLYMFIQNLLSSEKAHWKTEMRERIEEMRKPKHPKEVPYCNDGTCGDCHYNNCLSDVVGMLK